jgi:ABC-2 type transport system permease protein
MKGILSVMGRELRAFFFSPLAYIVAALLLVVNGLVFWLIVSYLNDPRARFGAPLELFFGQTLYFWLVLLFVAPVLTMRLLSEERRSGTIEVLMTAPVTEGQVVTGKYLAALLFYCFLWVPTVAYPALLAFYGDVDWGPVVAGYLGVLGIGALFLSVGLLASSLTRSQLVAAILTFAMLIPLFTFGLLENLFDDAPVREVLSYLNLWQHMEELGKGIVDTRHLVYYVSASALFVFLSARVLESRKWR